MKGLIMFVLLTFFASLFVPLSFVSADKLSIDDIINLKKIGFTDNEIVSEIKKTGDKYEFTEAEIQKLKDNGISEDLISFLKDPKSWEDKHPQQPEVPEIKPETPVEKPKEVVTPPLEVPTEETPAPVSPEEIALPKPIPQTTSKIPEQFIGTWTADIFDSYGNKIAYMQIQYQPDGKYTGYTAMQTAMGVQQTVNSGIVQVIGNVIQGYNQINQPFSYYFQFYGVDQLMITMPEWGGNITFYRQS
jgi:hypothetical protein